MSDRISKLLATFFFIGDFPVAPGSFASIAGALIGVALYGHWGTYVVVTLGITAVGFLVSGRMEAITGKKDPSCVVIDEVAGMLIALFMLPLTPAVFVTAFFLFRAFDMFKIYPANKLEGLHGSAGIMVDDLVAGLYTNITMAIALRWAGIV